MTKAQMAARIAELEKEVDALKAGANVETHIHYHYPQKTVDPTPYYAWWQVPQYPYYSVTGGSSAADSVPQSWTSCN